MGHEQHNTVRSLRAKFEKMTSTLFMAYFITALLNTLFGFDTSSFGGVQNIPSFQREFGSPVAGTNEYNLSAGRASLMSSIAFAGKFLGTLTAALYIERFGHRLTIWILCVISFVGIILECTSHGTVIQFIFGRIIVYYSVGIAENASATYQSEIVPAGMRGSIVSTVQLFNQFGQIMSTGVNRNFHTSTERKGWIIPVSIQAAVPFLLVFLTFLIPNGPRWLLSKSRKADAITVLERVRPREDSEQGLCHAEADAIEEALNNKTEKGPWMDLIRGTNLRRTTIATVVFVLQQFTGQAFVANYSPRFYASVGLSDHAFDYNIASATVAWCGVICAMVLIDTIGRRPLLIAGGVLQATFLFLVAAMGQKDSPSQSDARGLVAGVMLFFFFFSATWAPIAYVIGSEIGTSAVREKTMAFSSAINVVAAWLVNFTLPYLLARIGSNIGWIYGGFGIICSIYAYFCVPELMNRSLEELDELFRDRVSARDFSSTEVTGAGKRIGQLENERPPLRQDLELGKVEEAESVKATEVEGH